MRKDRLNVFEKLWLGLRAWYDVKYERFQYNEVIAADRSPRARQTSHESNTSDYRPPDFDPEEQQPMQQDPDEGGVRTLIISPFINEELGKFEALREHMLGSRHVFGWIVSDSIKRRLVFEPFAEVLGDLDQQVNVLCSKIDLLAIEYEEQIQQWQSRRETYESRREPHMVQMCINRIMALRSEYYSKTSRMYSFAVSMLSQKVKLITATEGLLRKGRGHCFLRIRYYYQKAVMRAERLPADYLSDEVLMSLANTELLMGYEDVRNDTQEELKSLRNEIKSFAPMRDNVDK